MRRTSTYFVGLVTMAGSLSFGNGPAAAQAQDLERVKKELSDSAAPRVPIGKLTLAGCDSYEEVRLSADVVALAVPCRSGGGLAAFDRKGSVIDTIPTGEFATLALWDIDEDGVLEMLLDEVTEWGTGILAREYRLYRLTHAKFTVVWRAPSVARSAPWTPEEGAGAEVESEAGFVRFEPSGGGQPARWVYSVSRKDPGAAVTFQESIYAWRQGEVVRTHTKEWAKEGRHPAATPRK